MAKQIEETKFHLQAEKKIPVFTVLKNNYILKNIFLLDNPPSIQCSDYSDEQENEEILVIGRHPNCNITLEHPSISRYHLRVHSKPSLQRLSVIDLSSVHGTWVSGNKIAPGMHVDLKEGETIQFGSSSRVYMLHWVPLSQAYDLEHPFVPPLDAMTEEEGEGDVTMDDNRLCVENSQFQFQTVCFDSEASDLLLSDKNLELYMTKGCPSASPIHVKNVSSQFEDEEADKKTPLTQGHDSEGSYFLCFDDDMKLSTRKLNPSEPPLHENNMSSSSCDEKELEHWSPMRKDYEQSDISSLCFGFRVIKEESSPQPPLSNRIPQTENLESPPMMSEQKTNLPNIWSRRGKFSNVRIQTGNSIGKSTTDVVIDSEVEPLHQDNMKSGCVSRALFAHVDDNDEESFTPDKENYSPNRLVMRSMKKMGIKEEMNLLNLHQSSSSKNVVGLNRHVEESMQLSLKKTVQNKEKCMHIGSDTDVENKENIENVSILRTPLTSLDANEEAIFTPDREIFNSRTLLQRSMKKMIKLGETQLSKFNGSFTWKNVVEPDSHQAKRTFLSSNTKNQSSTLLQEQKSVRPASRNEEAKLEPELIILQNVEERVPFQSLIENSNGKNNTTASVFDSTKRSGNFVSFSEISKRPTHLLYNNVVGGESKRWVMVVDTNSLLNKESRKALQLLQGLKGTRLIIPRIVIRELDCMKRRNYLFRRTTEVCSALQWIEDCMLNTKWWIHVQSSLEEGRPIAPTPPVSPLSRLSEECGGFPFGSTTFSPCGSLLEIISPTAEDHILECAIFFRRIWNDGQLVLLSDDVTQKIKAMAEGLICESAEEFRKSLVNPFSGRFLWAESSPKGPTWSCEDDVVLREMIYHHHHPCPVNKLFPKSSGEGGAKGLKLILFHNSHYRKISSVR